ncbi:MAG: choice-of-anchor J domain-containing protein [Muribaculaceae bacterium]|nr:choice-of-anchor J domain-containing protein [Muribaculaceae bacterium]
MNNSVKNIFFALGATAVLASCSENSWNDHLDGFESGVNYNTAIEGALTMSKADYKAVAENSANKELAGADTTALKAVGKNGYFTPQFPAVEYLPAFLASSDCPYFLASDGSKVNVTYNEAESNDSISAEIVKAATYTVTSADYQGAWKSDEDFIDSFAPMTPAATNLPAILKKGIADPTTGQYAVVNYAEASENPIFIQLGGGEAQMHAIYTEPFTENEGNFLIWNEVMPEGLSYVWKFATNYGMKASAFLSGQAYATEAWLISPEFTLGGDMANFSFEQATNHFTDIETAKQEATVWLRVSGDDWEQITGYDFPEKLSWDFVSSGDIDISKYCGSTIQIGFKYTSTAANAGTWEIKNFVVNAKEGSVGENPGFYGKPAKKVIANTPVIANKTAIYQYSGSEWKLAEGFMAVQPADYIAMGFKVNELQDPTVFLPLYLKQNAPYAVSGNSIRVVYNETECDVLVYNGQNWTVNNNNLQTFTAQFIKENGSWRFEKYMDSKSYVLFSDDEIVLDVPYLIVADDKCATALDASKTYGYLPVVSVDIVEDVIEQRGDANTYTFTNVAVVDGIEYTLEDGLFMIKDSLGRYLYMTGAYNSFNLSKTPNIVDGKISTEFIFAAKHGSEGVWTITNKGNEKYIQYSIKHGSYGCYASEQPDATLPALYILTEE